GETMCTTSSQPEPTVALVLETHNLGGGDADHRQLCASLTRLLEHLGKQTRPLASLDQVLVTHFGLSARAQAALDQAAGRRLTYLELPEGSDYYAAKNHGFGATSADVVVFADSDCWPDTDWLDQLLAPFFDEEQRSHVKVVAGR